MPEKIIDIPDVYAQVIRRVAVGVSKDLAKLMRLPSNTHVMLPGQTEQVPMHNSSIFGDCCEDGIRFENDTYLEMRFREENLDEVTLTTPMKTKTDYHPLFVDEVRDIEIYPQRRFVSMVCDLKFIGRDSVEVQRLVDRLRNLISSGFMEMPLSLEYHYALPDSMHKFLIDVYETMMASEVPYQGNFLEWFMSRLTNPVTVVSTLIDTANRLVFTERQNEVLGWFDFSSTPNEPEREGNAGGWSSTFTFTLHYDRPHGLYTSYPILVHQMALAAPYLPQKVFSPPYAELRKVSALRGALDAVLLRNAMKSIPYVRLPYIDDWMGPALKDRDSVTFFTAALSLKKGSNRLLDLANFDKDIKLHPAVVEYIQHKGNDLTQSGGSILEFRLYKNNQDMGEGAVRINGTHLESVEELDLQYYYHVTFRLKRNWYGINKAAMDCLRRYPTVYHILGTAVGHIHYPFDKLPLVNVGRPRSPSTVCPGETHWEHDFDGSHWLTPTGIVSIKEVGRLIEVSDDRGDNSFNKPDRGTWLVLYAELITMRKEEMGGVNK